MFNTASKRRAKTFFFSFLSKFRKLYKNYKNKQTNRKGFSSNYCLFTSHPNSLHLAACTKQFHSRRQRKHAFFFFFLYNFELMYGCEDFFKTLFLCSMLKGREASRNLYTVYTAHPLRTTCTPSPSRTGTSECQDFTEQQ